MSKYDDARSANSITSSESQYMCSYKNDCSELHHTNILLPMVTTRVGVVTFLLLLEAWLSAYGIMKFSLKNQFYFFKHQYMYCLSWISYRVSHLIHHIKTHIVQRRKVLLNMLNPWPFCILIHKIVIISDLRKNMDEISSLKHKPFVISK